MWVHVMCSSLYGGQYGGQWRGFTLCVVRYSCVLYGGQCCGLTLCVVRYTEASGVESRYV